MAELNIQYEGAKNKVMLEMEKQGRCWLLLHCLTLSRVPLHFHVQQALSRLPHVLLEIAPPLPPQLHFGLSNTSSACRLQVGCHLFWKRLQTVLGVKIEIA